MSLTSDYDWGEEEGFMKKFCPNCGTEFELFDWDDVHECPNCGETLEEEEAEL